MTRAARFILIAALTACAPHLARASSDDAVPLAAPLPPAPPPAVQAAEKAAPPQVITTDLADDTGKTSEMTPLLWKEKDVPPFCFDQMMMFSETVQTRVSIPDCESDPEKAILRTYHEDGWVRTDYRYKDDSDYPALTSMYRVIGKTRDGYAVEMSSATGGSGRFSGIIVVKVAGPVLELLHNYGAGDRCNSGVASAEVKGGDVFYGFYLTPGDFATVAYGNDQGLVAYEDLEASAMSCFAVQHYKNGTMERIELNPEAFKEDQEGWTTNYALQSCMNLYLRKSVASGKTSFTLKEFKAFMDGFRQNCQKA